ncbi:MAG TPA: M20/M25/M40 family metallo-hydrolase [Steroidobacteraceae bacterium]|nr:M20/M25/M40 family metallo-hydrolase [Steroidobacteraceae bacterium]
MEIVVRCARLPTLALCAVLAPALGVAADDAAQSPKSNWTEQQLATAAALRDRALSGTSAYDHVASLVTEVGPRSAGSSGDAAAVRWALNKLGSLGFSNVRSQDVLVPRWVRGHAEVTLAGPHPQPLVAVALGGSVGTSDEGIEAQVLEVASLDALNALPADKVGGKIVFINERMERTRDGSGYGAAVKNRTDGPSAAGNLGAVAVLIRSIGTSDERHAHTGTTRYRVDAPRIPALALSNPDADQLARWLKPGKPVRLQVKSTARELPPSWSANVIGEIPGSERGNEIVLLGAHLDSWDLGQGAIDDGAGVAIVIEAARMIARLERKPARTVRVVLFANEEFGLSGAREYARLAGDEIARHVLAIEADLGAGAVWRVQSQVAPEAVPAVDAIREALKPLSLEAGGNEAHGGSDIGPLRALGVPILDLSQDATSYFDVHHTVNDTLPRIDAKTLNQVVAAYATTAYMAASKNGDFGRLPVEEKKE